MSPRPRLSAKRNARCALRGARLLLSWKQGGGSADGEGRGENGCHISSLCSCAQHVVKIPVWSYHYFITTGLVGKYHAIIYILL